MTRFLPLLISIGFLIALIITTIVSALFGVPLVALNEVNVSIAVFDYWSVGHLLVGISIFVAVFTIGFIIKNLQPASGAPPTAPRTITPPIPKKFIIYWLITLLVAVIWEIIENTLLVFVNVKSKFDSPANIITDILIWGIGGLGSWYMTDLMFLSKKYIRAYYIYGVINLFTGIIIFVVFGFITTNF